MPAQMVLLRSGVACLSPPLCHPSPPYPPPPQKGGRAACEVAWMAAGGGGPGAGAAAAAAAAPDLVEAAGEGGSKTKTKRGRASARRAGGPGADASSAGAAQAAGEAACAGLAPLPPVRGCILLSYPLHPPGKPVSGRCAEPGHVAWWTRVCIGGAGVEHAQQGHVMLSACGWCTCTTARVRVTAWVGKCALWRCASKPCCCSGPRVTSLCIPALACPARPAPYVPHGTSLPRLQAASPDAPRRDATRSTRPSHPYPYHGKCVHTCITLPATTPFSVPHCGHPTPSCCRSTSATARCATCRCRCYLCAATATPSARSRILAACSGASRRRPCRCARRAPHYYLQALHLQTVQPVHAVKPCSIH